MGENMNVKSKSVFWQLTPGVILGISILLGLMILGDVNQVSTLFLKFKWIYFVYAILFSIVNYLFRFLKRHYCLNRGGVGNFSFRSSFHLFLVSFPLSVTPMKVGESFKGIWMNRLSGIPVDKAVSIFIVDHFSDGLSVFLLTAFGTIAYPRLWPFFLIVLGLFLIAIVFVQIKPFLQNFLNLGEKMPFISTAIRVARNCIDSNPDLLQPGPLFFTSLMGLISWLADGAALFMILLGLGFPLTWALVAICMLVFAFSMLMAILSAFPGGVGVMEVAMAALLTLFLDFKPEVAAAVTILFRLATFWFGFITGVLILYFTGKSLGIQTNEGRIIES